MTLSRHWQLDVIQHIISDIIYRVQGYHITLMYGHDFVALACLPVTAFMRFPCMVSIVIPSAQQPAGSESNSVRGKP
jgi:hypothetical protein